MKILFRWSVLALLLFTFSCAKTNIEFSDTGREEDPDITFLENAAVKLETYKTDSFVTSGSNVFIAGRHADPFIGTTMASSYFDLVIPAKNTAMDEEVIFDSMVMMVVPNGSYYGDTAIPVTYRIYQLTEEIENESDDPQEMFNGRTFKYDQRVLSSLTTQIRPLRGSEIRFKMPDQMGRTLLDMFRKDDDKIRTQEEFRRFFKGLLMQGTDPSNKCVYYFKTAADNAIMRIYFRIKSPFNEAREIEFGINTSKQFNNIQTNHTGTPLSAFPVNQDILLPSSRTDQKSYVFSPAGIYTKISFPDIFDIKDRADFSRIVKAELEIKPLQELHSRPYQLAPKLLLYLTNSNNLPSLALADETSREELDGDLIQDALFSDKTAYTYDITGYINSLILEGRFSESALIISEPIANSGSKLGRLIIPDQSGSKKIRLKLYLLTF
jgi:hypothetical protein